MNLTQKMKLVFAVSLAAAGSAFAATVYEVPAGNNTYYSTSLEYGDEIRLDGYPATGWVLQSVTIPYYSNYENTGGLSIKIYANDGALVNGKASPGSVLYSSGPIDVLNNGGTVTVPFANIPDNLVPSSFTYSVSFSGVGGANQAGLYVPNAAPSVGSSFNDFWQNTGSGWELRTMQSGDLANFQVSITAVPEPSVVALASLGLVGLSAYAVRRSRKA